MKVIFLLVFLTACGVSESSYDKIGTQDNDDNGVVVVQTSQEASSDAGVATPAETQVQTLAVCSVEIELVFKHGEGIEIRLKNGNDTSVIAEITNETTGGITLRECLWPDQDDHKKATFNVGDELTAIVLLGDGNYGRYTCHEKFFEYCDELTILIR